MMHKAEDDRRRLESILFVFVAPGTANEGRVTTSKIAVA
jgi:hypothetical protein